MHPRAGEKSNGIVAPPRALGWEKRNPAAGAERTVRLRLLDRTIFEQASVAHGATLLGHGASSGREADCQGNRSGSTDTDTLSQIAIGSWNKMNGGLLLTFAGQFIHSDLVAREFNHRLLVHLEVVGDTVGADQGHLSIAGIDPGNGSTKVLGRCQHMPRLTGGGLRCGLHSAR
jgi:hypothetical protein